MPIQPKTSEILPKFAIKIGNYPTGPLPYGPPNPARSNDRYSLLFCSLTLISGDDSLGTEHYLGIIASTKGCTDKSNRCEGEAQKQRQPPVGLNHLLEKRDALPEFRVVRNLRRVVQFENWTWRAHCEPKNGAAVLSLSYSVEIFARSLRDPTSDK